MTFPGKACRFCGKSYFSACLCTRALRGQNGRTDHIARLHARADTLPAEAGRIVREIVVRARSWQLEFR
jgi:hypothetical protein